MEWILCEVLRCSRVHLFAYSETGMTEAEVLAVERMIERRVAGEPLQYILGHTDFFGLRLAVEPGVLIPRPETEQVVEAALEVIAGVEQPRVLDAGTGSGCIALAIRHQRREAAVAACDVSPKALAVARRNATALDLDVAFHEADLLADDFAERVPGQLDLLISNPPYIPDGEAGTLAREVREHEPSLALFAGDDALVFYRALLQHSSALLRPGGWLVVETHADYGADVAALYCRALTDVELREDLAGRPRIVLGRRSV